MSLGEQLERIRAGSAKRVPEDQRAVMGAANEELRQSGILDTAAKVGDPLPEFALRNVHDEEISSVDLLVRGPLVLTVFRGVW